MKLLTLRSFVKTLKC